MRDDLELKMKVLALPLDICVSAAVKGQSSLQGVVDVALKILQDIDQFEEALRQQTLVKVLLFESVADVSISCSVASGLGLEGGVCHAWCTADAQQSLQDNCQVVYMSNASAASVTPWNALTKVTSMQWPCRELKLTLLCS